MRLTDDQRAAVECPAPHRVIIAGAGCGKTTTLVEVIHNLVVDRRRSPDAIAAVSFTRNAAGELRQRVTARLGAQANAIAFGTSYSLALQVVRGAALQLGLFPWFQVYDEADDADLRSWVARTFRATKHAVSEEIDAWMASCELRPQPDQRLAMAYVNRMDESGAITLERILPLAIHALGNKQVQHRWAYRCRYLIVDEYQDTAPIEARFYAAITPVETVVVGDPDQNLYAFRGTDNRFLVGASEEGAAFYTMQGWRCGQRIVDFANRIVSDNPHRPQRKLAGRPDHAGVVGTIGHDRWATVAVDAARGGERVAVLARTNRGAAAAATALLNLGAKVAMLQNEKTFYGQGIVRAIHAAMRLRCGSRDAAAERLVVAAFMGMGETAWRTTLGAALAAVTEEKRLVDVLKWEGLAWPDDPVAFAEEAAAKLVEREPEDVFATRRRTADRLVALVRAFVEANPGCTLQDYVDHIGSRELAAFFASKKQAAEGSIAVGTVHAAKGMEWDTVFIYEFDDGVLPLDRADIEEERRVAYVAITRARTVVYCVWQQAPSPFIGDLERVVTDPNGTRLGEDAPWA